MIKQIVSVSSSEPVSLNRAKEHFRVTHDDDDDYIRDLIRAARERAETFCGRSFVERTITALFTAFEYEIELDPEPIIEVTKVEIKNASDTWVQLATNEYKIELLPTLWFDVMPSGIKATTGRENVLRVTYKTGYTTTNPVPHTVKQAILMIARTLYDNREDVVKGMTINAIPTTSMMLLQPYRIMKF